MIARLGLVICGGGGSGLVPPPLGPSSSRSTCVSARGTILSCLSGCCSEGPTWPLLRVSPGASEMVVDLSASGVTLVSLVPLPSESSISAPMQLYTMLTRSVDWMKTRMSKKYTFLILHSGEDSRILTVSRKYELFPVAVNSKISNIGSFLSIDLSWGEKK